MDWNRGFSATYYGTFVDPATWRDLERFEIISGSVSRSNSALRHSADVTCRSYDPGKERWVRIYLDARQEDTGAHEAIFTGLATSPEVSIDGNIKTYPLQCFSVLKPAEDIFLTRGWYTPAGANGAETIRQLLTVCPCPVTISADSPVLSQAIVAEDSETNLSMIEKILQAIGWRLRIHGDGTVEVAPQADTPTATFDVLENDSIEPAITLTSDWHRCPNCFRAVRDDMSGTARDDDPDSPLSTVTRGREVWAQDTSCDLADDESITEYARRRLEEEQRAYIKIKYSRRFFPGLLVTDLVRLHYPAQGVNGIYRISTQDIALGHGATTSEEVTNGGNEDDGE